MQEGTVDFYLGLGQADEDVDLFLLGEGLLDLLFCAAQHKRAEDLVELLDHLDVLLLELLLRGVWCVVG